MATNTYVALATATASGSSGSQLVMSSIPSTYTDLVFVANTYGSANNQEMFDIFDLSDLFYIFVSIVSLIVHILLMIFFV